MKLAVMRQIPHTNPLSPHFIGAGISWTQGTKKLTSLPDCVGLAAQTADEALKNARARGLIGEASK